MNLPGVGELPGDGLRLVAPVVAVLPRVVELRAQKVRSVTQRRDLRVEGRGEGRCMPKHTGTWVSYLRVSTDKQGKSGLGLEAQRKAVADFLNGGKWTLAEEFVEIESGKRGDRPELAKALAACKKLKAKLVVAKLDRLARNVHFVSGLMESGVDFVAADMPFANRLTVHILAAVAEHEREAISQRTKAALAAAKARGVKLGGPALDRARLIGNAGNRKAADRFAANVKPIIAEIRKSGATSLRAVATALSARGVPTARGGQWNAQSAPVARLTASLPHSEPEQVERAPVQATSIRPTVGRKCWNRSWPDLPT